MFIYYSFIQQEKKVLYFSWEYAIKVNVMHYVHTHLQTVDKCILNYEPQYETNLHFVISSFQLSLLL